MERDLDDCTVQILEKNDIVANRAGQSGGGIAVKGSDNKGNLPQLKIQHSQLHRNKAYGLGYGGALYAVSAECTLEECLVFRNEADSLGGGIHISGDFDGTSLDISANCDLYENRAKYGGAIYAGICPATIRDSKIRDNVARTGGGISFGVYDQYQLDLERVEFTHNRATFRGGAIDADSVTVIDDCHFVRNEAEMGAALAIRYTILDLEDSEFKLNVASDRGGACAIDSGHGQLIESNSFVQNSAGEGGALVILDTNGATLPIQKNTFNGNKATYPTVDAADILVNGGRNYAEAALVKSNTFTGAPSVLVK
jgi:predicted outer membrane repeat protein